MGQWRDGDAVNVNKVPFVRWTRRNIKKVARCRSALEGVEARFCDSPDVALRLQDI